MQERLLESISYHCDKTFVVCNGEQFTYGQLLWAIKELNKFIVSNKYRKVLLELPQGFLLYSGILSCYFSRSTFCVINPELPCKRKHQIITTFKPDVIFTYREDYIETEAVIVMLELFLSDVGSSLVSNTDKLECFSDNNIIYVSFTSGSTGIPKGCVIKRKSVERIISWAIKEFELTEADIWGQYLSPFFDMGLLDVFGAPLIGATLISFPNISDKLRPGKLIKQYNITFLNIVPSVIDILIKARELNFSFCRSLKYIRFGGDKIYTVRIEQLFDILPNLIVFSTYGATETTLFCMSQRLDKSNFKNHCTDIATIGRPLPGYTVELENVTNNIGEVVIYSKYIGAGYIGGNNSGYGQKITDGKCEMYYKTGDFAEIIHENLYFRGRKDSQIKINGQRFDLVEIECILISLGCDECAALAIENKIICVYTSSKHRLETIYLEGKLAESIPVLFLPKVFLQLSELPYNSNGKIDRAKIREIVGELI